MKKFQLEDGHTYDLECRNCYYNLFNTCRRNAPIPTMVWLDVKQDNQAIFPNVNSNDWCGEFVPSDDLTGGIKKFILGSKAKTPPLE